MKWILFAVLCLSAFACKSQKVQKVDPLPFHVAILPVDVEKVELVTMDDDDKIEVQLNIDPLRFSEAMVAALDGTAFTQATLLSTPEEGASEDQRAVHWLAEAQAVRADLILDADVNFDEDIGTEINDKFWMNLPLFLLGGPATWFVNDLSYQFHVEISAHVYDVTAATREQNSLDQDSQITRMDAVIQEASLDFLDRADGTGSYALSILVPSGFLSKDTDNVPEELEVSITEQLGVQVAQAIQSRSKEVAEAENLVDFHPEKKRYVEVNGELFLEVDFLLATGQVTDLSALSYRIDGSGPIEATWSEVSSDGDKKKYVARVPVPARDAVVQLEVEQDDREASARSFTYSTVPEEAK